MLLFFKKSKQIKIHTKKQQNYKRKRTILNKTHTQSPSSFCSSPIMKDKSRIPTIGEHIFRVIWYLCKAIVVDRYVLFTLSIRFFQFVSDVIERHDIQWDKQCWTEGNFFRDIIVPNENFNYNYLENTRLVCFLFVCIGKLFVFGWRHC